MKVGYTLHLLFRCRKNVQSFSILILFSTMDADTKNDKTIEEVRMVSNGINILKFNLHIP